MGDNYYLTYCDDTFYCLRTKEGWYMEEEGGIRSKNCGNPLDAVRFDFRWQAESYIAVNELTDVVSIDEVKVNVGVCGTAPFDSRGE